MHYSGHGAFEGDMGYLVLENEEGLTDLVPADQFARSLEQYHSLQLITLSGCQTAQFSDYENLNGVAQCLIQAGFPMVIGMQRSISDRAATSFAHHFYAQLAQQKGVNEALSATRQAMLREEQRFLKEGRKDIIPGEWTIPVLIRKNEQNHIVDFRKAPVSEAGETPQRLLFSCARPLGRGFVGRRKEIRQFYQLYHAGNRAIALWGYGGVGKSSLATRLAEELNQRHDYHVFGFKGGEKKFNAFYFFNIYIINDRMQ